MGMRLGVLRVVLLCCIVSQCLQYVGNACLSRFQPSIYGPVAEMAIATRSKRSSDCLLQSNNVVLRISQCPGRHETEQIHNGCRGMG